MRLEDMPVETMFYRTCQCGAVTRSFDQYQPCFECGRKDQFRKFQTEPLHWSLDRAVRALSFQERSEAAK